MIFHTSIPARDPERVARVMGELLGGPVMQFVPGPGSFVVFPAQGDGTCVEIVPTELRHAPGAGSDDGIFYTTDHGPEQAGPNYSASHVAIASPLSAEQIIAIGRREEWRAVRCWRATAFELVELWLENSFLIEFFPPDMQSRIRDFMKDPATWQSYFGLEDDGGIARVRGSREQVYAQVRARGKNP